MDALMIKKLYVHLLYRWIKGGKMNINETLDNLIGNIVENDNGVISLDTQNKYE